MINKKKLIEEILAQLEKEQVLLTQSAQAAHEAATHEESKAEDQHDTRGLEASYLANAQGTRIQELNHLILMYRRFPLRDFKPTDPIAVGALIELDLDGKRFNYFLATHGGGLLIPVAKNRVVQVITPLAPLGEAMIDRKVGDSVEIEVQGILREYEVVQVS